MRRGVLASLLLAMSFGGTAAAVEPSPAMQSFLERQAKLRSLGDAPLKAMAADGIFYGGFEGDGALSCDADTDGDTLPDCAETNTGTYVSISDTGTDPNHADSDRDGFKDGEELLGTLDGLDLPALGVSPLRRDLLIEYDWFDDSNECGAHSHEPTAAVLERVRAAYAAAPVQNPDGSTGINVIQDVGQGGALNGGNLITGENPVMPGALDGKFYEIRGTNSNWRRIGYFRYVLLAHRYNGGSNSSGYAEIVGDDVLVTLNCAGTEANTARTILHEVGHNLGLDHGGFEACNGKPNYNSLMNYRYQFAGLDAACSANGDGRTDGYSRGDRLTIDESQVDEQHGVCGNPAIDWNQNGSVESGIALDLNPGNESTCGAALSQIEDFDDWANITMVGIQDKTGALKGIKRETGCAGAPAPEG
jgi:hypothetical protein